VLSLAFSPDGRLLAAATESSPSIYVWDTATGEEIASVDAHDGHPISVAFTPDGKHLVSDGSDQTVKVFDTATWKQQSMITGGFGVMGDIALSPAGTHVAFAGSGRVLLWRIGASRELQTLGPPNGSIRGMAAPEVAFSPDGKTVAYTDGEFDQTIVLWDSVARRIVTELQTSATVQSIAFLPGGKKLVSGHSSGEVMVWNVDTGTWLQRACERAGRNMTEEEWASTFGDELRYQESCPDYPGGQAASGEASGPAH
jgi:WD40 repeat protein